MGLAGHHIYVLYNHVNSGYNIRVIAGLVGSPWMFCFFLLYPTG